MTDVYLITDLMMADLSKLMDSDCVFTNEQVRCIMFQFLRALEHLHHCEIIHRDIKPSNLLLDRLWHLKICDLGIAREAMISTSRERMEDFDIHFTDYVVTRPYRAPELLMGSKNYTSAVDMWAAGCILAELIAGQMEINQAPMTRNTSAGMIRLPLFPGFDHRDMVQRIIHALGHPSDEVGAGGGGLKAHGVCRCWTGCVCGNQGPRTLCRSKPTATVTLRPRRSFTELRTLSSTAHWMEKRGSASTSSLSSARSSLPRGCCSVPSFDVCRQVNFKAIFPWGDDDAVDLMEKLLVYDPEQRLTAEEALEHPYFKKHVDKYVQEHMNMSVITQNDAEIVSVFLSCFSIA